MHERALLWSVRRTMGLLVDRTLSFRASNFAALTGAAACDSEHKPIAESPSARVTGSLEQNSYDVCIGADG